MASNKQQPYQRNQSSPAATDPGLPPIPVRLFRTERAAGSMASLLRGYWEQATARANERGAAAVKLGGEIADLEKELAYHENEAKIRRDLIDRRTLEKQQAEADAQAGLDDANSAAAVLEFHQLVVPAPVDGVLVAPLGQDTSVEGVPQPCGSCARPMFFDRRQNGWIHLLDGGGFVLAGDACRSASDGGTKVLASPEVGS